MPKIRSPICSVLGHVDHGKSSILDQIRGSAIIKTEAGGITQAIGASIIPLKVIKKICGDLLKSLKMDFTIPGLLFIDTPGHAAFTSLRKRGGSLADIAILVVDVTEGFKPQTFEALEILKSSKTPFIVAANKIDKIAGWKSDKKKPLLENINSQPANVLKTFETRMYELVGKLSESGFGAERFDRVNDYTKQVAIIPTSGMTGEGIPELLMVLTGLAQRYLEKGLEYETKGAAKGTVLEVKDEKGYGKTVDVIIYDGTLKVNDGIVIGGIDKAVVTKVKGLFEPKPLEEMRDKKSKFKPMKEVTAATGVKILAKELDKVVAGMPLMSFKKDSKKAEKEIQKQIESVMIDTEAEGIIIKADSIGSLEALIFLLKEADIPIRKAMIGNISKKDISDAQSNFEMDPLTAVILGFNVVNEIKKTGDVKVILGDVIYKIIENYERWKKDKKKEMELEKLGKLVRPFKLEILRGYVFRQSNPAIVGVEVSNGTLAANTPIMNKNGKHLADIKGIQLEQKNVEKAEKGKQVAISIPGLTVGRQIKEGDILYSDVPEEDFRKLKETKELLSKEEKELLKEIAEIKRKDNAVWGV